MLTQRRFLLAAFSAIALLGSAYSAHAIPVEFLAGEGDSSVRIVMDEDDGNVVVSLFANEGVTDLRKVSLDIIDDSKLKGLTVIGDDVTAFTVRLHRDGCCEHHDEDRDFDDERDDKDHDRGNKDHDRKDSKDKDHRGKDKDHGSKKDHDRDDEGHHFGFGKDHDSRFEHDIAIALGTSFCKDGLLETTFVLDAKADLAIADFVGEQIELRVTGLDEKDREVSLRLVATVPVPEPSTALLLGLGVGALGYAARSRR